MKLQMKALLSRIEAHQEKGQTLIEYALIILLISVVVIIVLGLLGADIDAVFQTIRATFSAAGGTT